jgi:hypothetical protein
LLGERTLLQLQLADHFSPPYDEQSHFFSLFNLRLTSDRASADAPSLAPEEWTDVELRWNCDQGFCSLLVNGAVAQTVRQQHVSPGPSYLRFQLDHVDANPAGRILVESVQAEVSPSAAAEDAGG